jgi:16S rRNA (guanine(527)-N(7))-methyltransferase RsmG
VFHVKHPSPPNFDVSRETRVRLDAYLALLGRWNQRINLVGPSPAETWWARHVEDALQLVPLLPESEGPIADLGSGAGLPGLILAACVTRPMHLVEADQRKCAFLREAAREMGLPHVFIHAERIETASLPPLAVITARALAPLTILLGHSHRLLAPDGITIFPKGRTAEAELTGAAPRWHMQVERFTSRTEAHSTILRIRDLRPA